MKLSSVMILAGGLVRAVATSSQETSNLRRGLATKITPNWAPTQKCSNGERPEHELEIEFRTDKYNSESLFWVSPSRKPSTAVLKHTKFEKPYVTYSLSNRVCAGDYIINVQDSYGDGICCAYGNGYYKVIVDGKEVYEGGEFDDFDSYEFSIQDSISPQDFYGWDGMQCVTPYGRSGSVGNDYEVFRKLNFEECMHKASEKKKYKGVEYKNDECHVWTKTPSFRKTSGAFCFVRKFNTAK